MGMAEDDQAAFNNPAAFQKRIKQLESDMRKAASDLEFEEAARIRDQIRKLEAMDLGLTGVMTNPRLANGWSVNSSAPVKKGGKKMRVSKKR